MGGQLKSPPGLRPYLTRKEPIELFNAFINSALNNAIGLLHEIFVMQRRSG
jgi:hypothetical protein